MASDSADEARLVALTMEAQEYGQHLVRLSEAQSRPITDFQYDVLSSQEDRLRQFGLRLAADLDGSRSVQAGNRVGTYRFGDAYGTVLVQIDPKVESADVFKMLDRAHRTLGQLGEDAEIPVGAQPASGVFLLFFATRVREALQRSRFRTYRFADESSSTQVRGRPLLREYVTRNIPQGRAHVLPHRHLDFTANVFENQVIAYAVLLATRLTTLLGLDGNERLRRELQSCQRLLVGVEPRRVTARQVRSNRYDRSTRHFEEVHRLCLALIENQSVTLEAGERIPFASFSLNMPTLFERYVASALKAALGERFTGDKRRLEYQTAFGGKPIRLDGLAVDGPRRLVVEAKYRTLDEPDDDLVLGQVPEKHVYQTVAYATHEEIRGRQAVIVYPTWEPGPAVRISSAIGEFGWSRGSAVHLEVRLVGVDLAVPFSDLVGRLRAAVSPLISAA